MVKWCDGGGRRVCVGVASLDPKSSGEVTAVVFTGVSGDG